MRDATVTHRLDGADLRVERLGGGLVRLHLSPFPVSDLYQLFPEILDGAPCAVTVYGEPGFYSGMMRDAIGNKFLTDILEQRERLEFRLTEREASAAELARALEVGPDHELFSGGYFHVLSRSNRHTQVVCREDAGVVEKVVPYFLRRPWFDPPEKHVRSDPFTLPKFLPAARAGIHVDAGRLVPLEESEPATLGVGPFAAQPFLTAERRAAAPSVETIRYGCDAGGNLRFIAREEKPLDAWLASPESGATPEGSFRPLPWLAGSAALAALAAPFAAGAAGRALAALACLLALAAVWLLVSARSRRAAISRVTLDGVRLSSGGGKTRLEATLVSAESACLDRFHADLVLRDASGGEAGRAPVDFPFLPPGARFPVAAEFADPAGAGVEVSLEPVAGA